MIFRLCANTESSGPALRYLRSSRDFVFKQLSQIDVSREAIDEPRSLRTLGWLLKLAVLELHFTSSQRQRSNTVRLVQLIFQRGSSKLIKDANGTTLLSSTIGELSALGADESNQLKIVEFFKGVSLSQNFPPAPSCDLLDIAVVEHLAKNATKDGQVDLIALHDLLRLELGPQVDQSGKLSHPKLETEVENVLRWLHQVKVKKSVLLTTY